MYIFVLQSIEDLPPLPPLMPPLSSLDQAPVLSRLKQRKIAQLSKRPSKRTRIESQLVMDSTDVELVRGGQIVTST